MRLMHRGLEIGLDSKADDISFLSHAHSDHLFNANSCPVLTSHETRALANIKGENVNVSGVRLIEAGHILGARQLVLEGDKKIVYTGDISLKNNIFDFKAKIEECDYLIIESTYASPEYKFPDPFEIYDEISKWVKMNENKIVLIGAYELGKAQELIRVLNEYNHIVPLVTQKTDFFCSVYESVGFKLDRIAIGSEEAEEALNHPFVAVIPMRLAKKNFAMRLKEAFGKETLVSVASGWALRFKYNVDRSFPLSDHADFDDLLFYIEQSNPKNVEFFDGGGEHLLKKIKNKEMISC
ncbi:MAG: hypothetical protein QXY64_04220 [Candidatus Bilamarchaeaceae archaeon]